MAHLLSCRLLLLDEACTADDLATVTERAKACARKWGKNGVKYTKEEESSVHCDQVIMITHYQILMTALQQSTLPELITVTSAMGVYDIRL